MELIGANRLLCALAAAAVALTPVHATACTIIPFVTIKSDEPANFRDKCRLAISDSEAYLASQRSEETGYYQSYEWVSVAQSLRDGSARCPRRSAKAFESLDSGIGSPVRTWPGASMVELYLGWANPRNHADRIEEIVIGTWLTNSTESSDPCSTHYVDALPSGKTEADVLSWLERPDYWSIAVEQFGNNPARDRLVLKQLIDPQSSKFDLGQAADLAPKTYRRWGTRSPRLMDIAVAEALLDPQLGDPDYEAAAALLGWYSPYSVEDLSEEDRERSRQIWIKISQSRLTSPDPKLQREGHMFLRTGDPWATPGEPIEEILPEGAKIVRLDHWPDALAPVSKFERFAERIQARGLYPSRLLRERRGGSIKLGVVFGPDGSFYKLHVEQGSSRHLETAAARNYTRYFRPRFSNLVLEGYEGQYVWVPLPSIEYRIAYNSSEMQLGYDAESNAIVILGRPLRPNF